MIPQAAKLAKPHIDISRNPLAHFSDAASREVNAQQEKDVGEVMTTIDRRLRDLDSMGIDIQVVAPGTQAALLLRSIPKSPKPRIASPMMASSNIARVGRTVLSGSAS